LLVTASHTHTHTQHTQFITPDNILKIPISTHGQQNLTNKILYWLFCTIQILDKQIQIKFAPAFNV